MKRSPEMDHLFYPIVSKLMAALDEGPTPIGELLELHLMTEVILGELLRHAFAGNAKAVLEQDLRYPQKLAICARLQHPDGGAILRADLVRSMKQLNELREQVVHNLGRGLSAADVDALFVGELGRARAGAGRHDDVHAQLRSYKAALYVHLLKPRAATQAMPCGAVPSQVRSAS
jgi:hypothetical protein